MEKQVEKQIEKQIEKQMEKQVEKQKKVFLIAHPGVSAAILCAICSTLSAVFKGFKWTRKMSFLPLISGLSTLICRSNLPGRSIAWSNISARFVPASTTTPVSELNPSISTSSWLRVFSRSSLPPLNWPFPRARATASISSINTMHGRCALCKNQE